MGLAERGVADGELQALQPLDDLVEALAGRLRPADVDPAGVLRPFREVRLDARPILDGIDLRAQALGRAGEEAVLDVLQRLLERVDQLATRHDARVELAVLAVEPVAADDRDGAARDVAAADLDHDRRTLLDPAPALGRRLGGLEVEEGAYRLAERGQAGELRPQVAAISDDRLVLGPVAQHGDDHHLPWRDRGRDGEAVVVPVDHDDRADHPRADAPAGRVGQLQLAAGVLEADVLRAGEIGAEEVAGARLERLAVLHHRLDRVGRDGTGEALVLGLLASDDVDREAGLGKFAVHLEHLQRLVARLVGGGVSSMALLPEELAGAQEHPRAHLPADNVGPLVDEDGQVAPRLHPAREGGADHRLRGGADDERLLELRGRIGDEAARAVRYQPVVGNDRHLLGEALDVLGLLLEIGERDEEREIAILVAGRLDSVVEEALDPLPDAVTPGANDHAAAHARFLGEVGFGDDGLVPGGEIRLAGDGECVLHGGATCPNLDRSATPVPPLSGKAPGRRTRGP